MEWAWAQWVPHSTCTLLGFVELKHTWFSLPSQKQNLIRALPFPHVSSLLEALRPFGYLIKKTETLSPEARTYKQKCAHTACAHLQGVSEAPLRPPG